MFKIKIISRTYLSGEILTFLAYTLGKEDCEILKYLEVRLLYNFKCMQNCLVKRFSVYTWPFFLKRVPQIKANVFIGLVQENIINAKEHEKA
jgi:hypothetical protein